MLLKSKGSKYSRGNSVKVNNTAVLNEFTDSELPLIENKPIDTVSYNVFDELTNTNNSYEYYLGEFESDLADRINKLNDILLLIEDAKSLEKQVRKELRTLIKALGELTKNRPEEVEESTPTIPENNIDLKSSTGYPDNINNADLEDFK